MVYYSYICKEIISQIFITTLHLITILLRGKFTLFRRALNTFMLILSQSVFTVYALCTFNISILKLQFFNKYITIYTKIHSINFDCRVK